MQQKKEINEDNYWNADVARFKNKSCVSSTHTSIVYVTLTFLFHFQSRTWIRIFQSVKINADDIRIKSTQFVPSQFFSSNVNARIVKLAARFANNTITNTWFLWLHLLLLHEILISIQPHCGDKQSLVKRAKVKIVIHTFVIDGMKSESCIR